MALATADPAKLAVLAVKEASRSDYRPPLVRAILARTTSRAP